MKNKNSEMLNYKLDGFGNQRQNGFEHIKISKNHPKSNLDKNYNFDRKQKNIECFTQNISYDQNTFRDEIRRSKKSKWNYIDSRLEEQRLSGYFGRFESSQSPETNSRNRIPNFKDTEIESKRSRSYNRSCNISSSERRFTPRKRRRKSPSSVWDRLGSTQSPDRNSLDGPHRMKERTSDLVEFERELKEAGLSKNTTRELSVSTGKKNIPGKQGALISRQQPINPTYNPLHSPNFPRLPVIPKVDYNLILTPMPTVSVNNLPLVPGPTGLPVHITATGEQIPHDMEGRPIPFVPNGYYLPVDPTGRIFAHIVSPENQAIPIHMKEDGVLRLPNSEPVPYGPGHRLPVNIDGRVIFIGPDSRPLYPCHNLPKEPPRILLEMMKSKRNEEPGKKTSDSNGISVKNLPRVQTKTVETQNENQVSIQPPVSNIIPINPVQNSSEKVSKPAFFGKHSNKAQEKNEDIFKCTEIEKNLSISPFKSGVERSVPKKLTVKKNLKEDSCDNCSDVVLDSGKTSSVSPYDGKSEPRPNNGTIEEILIHSDEEQDALEIICDKEVPKANDDFIIEKIQRAIKFLCQKNRNFGRFIVPDLNSVPSLYNSPNESPLLRNRIQLSFHTPSVCLIDQPIIEEKPEINFKFLPQ